MFLRCVLQLIISLIILTNNVCGQLGPYEQFRIDTLMENLRQCTGTPGLQLGIVRNGVKAYIGSYGFKDLNTGSPITYDTIWPFASLSKAFTGVLLADIVENTPGYSWNTKLKSILPDLEMSDSLRTEEATIGDLVAHRMATSGYNGGWFLYTGNDGMTRQDMPSKMKYFESERPFRAEFHYNNWMYTLAGAVAEKITGKSWESLIREKIYQPLQMMSGTFSPDIVSDPRVPKSYGISPSGQPAEICMEPLETFVLQGPGGGLAGSTDDINMWMAYHVNRGMLPDGTTPIPEESLFATYGAQMALPAPLPTMYKPLAPQEWLQTTYGFGWMQTAYNGYRVIHHTGAVLGYTLSITIWPELGMAIFTAANAGLGPLHQIPHMFISDLLNPSEQPWINEYYPCPALQNITQTWSDWDQDWTPNQSRKSEEKNKAHHERIDKAPRPLNIYIGTYGHGFFGNAYVSSESGSLVMRQGKYGHLKFLPTSTANAFLVEDLSCLVNTRPPNLEQYALFVDEDNDGNIDAFTVQYLDSMVDVYFKKSLVNLG